MTLQLFAHPLSSYCQKALIALYENDIAFEFLMLDEEHPDNFTRLSQIWPVVKFPLLLDGDLPLIETTIIIEYLDSFHRGKTRFIPDDRRDAIEVRMMDRIFDNYVMTPMQKIGSDARRPADGKDPVGVAEARAMIEESYRWLNGRLKERTWAGGETFTLADCSAAPSLFYADWMQPISAEYGALKAYLARLQQRPSVARAAKEADPYLHMVPVARVAR